MGPVLLGCCFAGGFARYVMQFGAVQAQISQFPVGQSIKAIKRFAVKVAAFDAVCDASEE